MGLDITAFSNAVPSESDYAWHAYNVTGVPQRMDGKPEGRYEGEPTFEFRAGSYSGYNDWRSWLCNKFLGKPPQYVWDHAEEFAKSPFIELINFSDCEGAFGPVTSAKLFNDFVDNADKVGLQFGDEQWNINLYDQWQEAFELASGDGLLIFH